MQRGEDEALHRNLFRKLQEGDSLCTLGWNTEWDHIKAIARHSKPNSQACFMWNNWIKKWNNPHWLFQRLHVWCLVSHQTNVGCGVPAVQLDRPSPHQALLYWKAQTSHCSSSHLHCRCVTSASETAIILVWSENISHHTFYKFSIFKTWCR